MLQKSEDLTMKTIILSQKMIDSLKHWNCAFGRKFYYSLVSKESGNIIVKYRPMYYRNYNGEKRLMTDVYATVNGMWSDDYKVKEL